MSETQAVYTSSEPETVITTCVDPMGLTTKITFEGGKYSTSDPGIIAVLDLLADNPGVPIQREAAPKQRKAAPVRKSAAESPEGED